MNASRIVLIALVVWSCKATGQEFSVVKLPKPEQASYKFAQVEPSIAIHPNNPDKMVAGTVMNDYYYSRDGGLTWKSQSLTSKYGVNGDPVLHVSQKGWYYYFHLSNPPSGNWIDRIVCERSRWICGKWKVSATPPEPPKAQDKQWVAECPVTGNLYLTWTEFDKYGSKDTTDHSRIMFSKSEEYTNPKDKLIPAYFEQIIDGMVYELYFPELLKKHNCLIIKYLVELHEFKAEMNDNEKMATCKEVHDRLNDDKHPVKQNLQQLREIPEIALIEKEV